MVRRAWRYLVEIHSYAISPNASRALPELWLFGLVSYELMSHSPCVLSESTGKSAVAAKGKIRSTYVIEILM